MKDIKFKKDDNVLITDSQYTKDIGINGLTGVITKVIHKNTGITYNVKCSEDSLCCVPELYLKKI